jgi:phage terminase large subunit-like protein
MENIRLVDNIESFPIKLQRVVMGCDFAVSGNVGADYTCYTVWGKDVQGNYYLLYIFREKGLSHNEQIQKIDLLNRVFKPNEIVVENNGFQSILADMCVQMGIKNITPFTTTSGNKKDLRTGWASLAALFERGVIKCPYHPDTAAKIDQMFGEFNSVAFRSDKGTLESISGHDDTVSSSFMAINKLRESTVMIKIDAV